MATLRNIYLPFYLMGIANEPLQLVMWNMVLR